MTAERVFWGKPHRPYQTQTDEQGDPDLGLYQIEFEEVTEDGFTYLEPVTSDYLDGARTELFINTGYGSCIRRSQYPIRRFDAVTSHRSRDDANQEHAPYASNFDNSREVDNKQNATFYRVSNLPSPNDPIISLPSAPYSRMIFLVVEEIAHGPFVATEWEASDTEMPPMYAIDPPAYDRSSKYMLSPGRILRIDFQALLDKRLAAENNGVGFTVQFQKIMSEADPAENVPFLTPACIVGIIKSLVESQSGGRKFKAEPLVKAINSSQGFKHLKRADQSTIIEAMKTVNQYRSEDINEIIMNAIDASDQSNELVQNAIEESKERFEVKWRQELADQHQELSMKISAAQKEMSTIQSDIEDARRELERVRQEREAEVERKMDTEAIDKEIAAKTQSMNEEIRALEASRAEVQGELDELYDLKNLKGIIEEETQRRRFVEREIEQLEQTRRKVQDTLERDEVELQTRLRDIAPYVSALNHTPLPSQKGIQMEPLRQAPEVVDAVLDCPEQARAAARDYVLALYGRLRQERDRHYSDDALAALLVAHHQNFLTVLSGPPGIGKTSLCQILAEETGLGSRMHEVTVGRGWLSDRDLIGFHNSMTGQFAPASSGLYRFLSGTRDDVNKKTPPATVLLDEANLSVIEQYWSPFMKMADEQGEKLLHLSGGMELPIPESLRFFATTNHDATTEQLSARLIDRAAVVQPDMLPEAGGFAVEEELVEVPVYSAQTLKQLFGVGSQVADANSGGDMAIDEVIKHLKNRAPDLSTPFTVSPRKEQKVHQFTEVLRPLLRASSGLNESQANTLAQDYATLFFLLPMINGVGHGVRKRVDHIRDALEAASMDLSLAKIEDMLARSEHALGSISYFQY